MIKNIGIIYASTPVCKWRCFFIDFDKTSEPDDDLCKDVWLAMKTEFAPNGGFVKFNACW